MYCTRIAEIQDAKIAVLAPSENFVGLYLHSWGICIVDAFSDKDDKKSDAEQDEAAIAEARREAEERRKEKHRKMEEEREKMRQDIRDKVVFHLYLHDVLITMEL